LTAACHGLLDVSDPSRIRDQDVANATGANARRAAAVVTFMNSFGSVLLDVAYFTDEATYDTDVNNPADFSRSLDQRNTGPYLNRSGNPTNDPHLGTLDNYLAHSSLALDAIRRYSQESARGDYLAQLFALRGVTILQMAEDLCPGFPINDVAGDNKPLLSGPFTTDSATTYAIAQLDSALADAVDSTSYKYMGHLVKARALLDLRQYDAAAVEAAFVPTNFEYRSDPSLGNPFQSYQSGVSQYGGQPALADHEGGNGLGFLSEHDTVRVPYGYSGQRYNFPSDSLFVSLKYLSSLPNASSYVVASGVEARLIESEVALHANDGRWLTILNDLRTPVGLGLLTDPGTAAARVDLVYHERAFWLYLTGRRLGDLRRLMRNYGRSAESVFPTGVYILGGNYGHETAIGFNQTAESLYNNKITAGCTSL